MNLDQGICAVSRGPRNATVRPEKHRRIIGTRLRDEPLFAIYSEADLFTKISTLA